MDLRTRLARLGPPTRGTVSPPAEPAESLPPPPSEPEAEPARAPVESAHADAVLASLRAEILRLEARDTRRGTAPRAPPALAPEETDLGSPFTAEETEEGALHARVRVFDATARHGSVPLHAALEATAEAVAALSLDPSLGAFDPRRVLFLDTETTGLSGGTGTLAFLIGLGYFDARGLVLEQLFLADPEAERPMLARVAERLASASALVTFNGKAFDLPLLRSRFVLARLTAPPSVPHLDLLHVARRIYGARVERCQLTALERDVLGFERVGDLPGEELPSRYLRFVREGLAGPMHPVAEHNALDVVALAALLGELSARFSRADSPGRWEPSDLVGLARTTLRAGLARLAVAFADDASALGDDATARDAHVLAAKVHRRARDPEAVYERLQAALSHAPEDPALHLELARCLERGLGDPVRALEHALRAAGAESPEALTRRVQRLKKLARRVDHRQLKLPGF